MAAHAGPSRTYRGRRAVVVENHDLRVTVLEEGGHIAEMLDAIGDQPAVTPPCRRSTVHLHPACAR
jgi:hypothetical protein